MTESAYPLHWPEGWPRTPAKETARFRATLAAALAFVREELRRMGARDVLISSNHSLGDVHPKESGVAVYFDLGGERLCIPCERYAKLEDNLQAIGKTIEALRGIERWGAKHMVKAAFRGFKALPAPTTGWRAALELPSGTVTLEQAEAAYRRLAKLRHPDAGGSAGEMADLAAAIHRARADLGGGR